MDTNSRYEFAVESPKESRLKTAIVVGVSAVETVVIFGALTAETAYKYGKDKIQAMSNKPGGM